MVIEGEGVNPRLMEARLQVESALEALVQGRMEGNEAPAMRLTKEILMAGGKRVRPVLTLLAFELAGGSESDKVLNLALATELIHTATLVHDDVYDGAKMRRGVPTLHEKHGTDRAIIAGDYLFVLGFGLGGAYAAPIVERMASTSAAIAAGELKQLDHIGDLSTSPEDYYDIVRGKTAGPFASACACAAMVADATPAKVAALDAFGMEIGMAFQLVDDLLDLTGDERMGKPRGTDVHEGKMTLPIIHALPLLHGDGRRRLAEILRDFDDSQWPELTALLEEAGSFEYCRILVRNHISRALESLEVFPSGEVRDLLGQMAEQVMDRHV